MDLDMYRHGSTRANLQKLESYGNNIIEPGCGELASGLVGEGRLAEPEEIVQRLGKHFSRRSVAVGKRVLITAGPTQEAIDPVRYISNYSSGKMGYALARAFANAGAQVTLVSGPVALDVSNSDIKKISVRSAQEMFAAAETEFGANDLVIFAAAVADYAPAEIAQQKIKKKEMEFSLAMTKTVDIAGTLGPRKKPSQLLVGFALETNDELENAHKKLQTKQLDYIILNSLNDPGAGFAHDTNKITVIDREGVQRRFELKTKEEVAQDILELIITKWSET